MQWLIASLIIALALGEGHEAPEVDEEAVAAAKQTIAPNPMCLQMSRDCIGSRPSMEMS